MSKKIVVTGIGIQSCLGNTVKDYWTSLSNGVSGIRTITQVSSDDFPCKVSGEVQNFEPGEWMNPKEAKRMGRFSQLAVAAAKDAVEQSKFLGKIDTDRIGVLIGTGAGGLPETDQQAAIKETKGVMRMSPFYIPSMLSNMASANISRIYQATGYNNTCITACAASTQAIGEAAEIIKNNKADIVITGGAESGICEIGMGGFSTMHALSTWDGDPSKASRPFDANRDGFAPSEGAGILILESEEHALNRGAKPIAEIAGFGVTSDAFHLVQPHKEGLGATKAMKLAIEDAGLEKSEIDYINAHGTSTPTNDRIETLAIKNLFGDEAYNIPISSTKSMVGHSLGASGALEIIACIQSTIHGEIHPTINLENPDPECDLNYVPNKKIKKNVDIALSNSFGFGGQNACVVIKKY
ncbi:MAG: beta-ketoacyl-[acyl-carrier-protein] synthase II [Chloroflexi bacterium]|nr:beta-ketoacyl-[acyl-carrier-protein] synthase II [Chloroflexota bacterium]|tara:strand:+ start:6416 stop:7648 length:1233 start_codon:yes stop_codon:yes gene_type:complete